MSKSDYYRPAAHQITHIYRCASCRSEQEFPSDQTVEGGRCGCGGVLTFCGESYPGNADDWDEERGRDGEWHQRR